MTAQDMAVILSQVAPRVLHLLLQALLSSRVHTPLHEAALSIIVANVAPGMPLPRGKTMALLYHLLGVVPAYR